MPPRKRSLPCSPAAPNLRLPPPRRGTRCPHACASASTTSPGNRRRYLAALLREPGRRAGAAAAAAVDGQVVPRSRWTEQPLPRAPRSSSSAPPRAAEPVLRFVKELFASKPEAPAPANLVLISPSGKYVEGRAMLRTTRALLERRPRRASSPLRVRLDRRPAPRVHRRAAQGLLVADRPARGVPEPRARPAPRRRYAPARRRASPPRLAQGTRPQACSCHSY
jgi:hypothetical protein